MQVGKLVIAAVLAVAAVVAGVRANDLYANVPVTWINGRGIPLKHIEGFERAFDLARREIPGLAQSMSERIGKRRSEVAALWALCLRPLGVAGYLAHRGVREGASR